MTSAGPLRESKAKQRTAQVAKADVRVSRASKIRSRTESLTDSLRVLQRIDRPDALRFKRADRLILLQHPAEFVDTVQQTLF